MWNGRGCNEAPVRDGLKIMSARSEQIGIKVHLQTVRTLYRHIASWSSLLEWCSNRSTVLDVSRFLGARRHECRRVIAMVSSYWVHLRRPRSGSGCVRGTYAQKPA